MPADWLDKLWPAWLGLLGGSAAAALVNSWHERRKARAAELQAQATQQQAATAELAAVLRAYEQMPAVLLAEVESLKRQVVHVEQLAGEAQQAREQVSQDLARLQASMDYEAERTREALLWIRELTARLERLEARA
jgi:chromosome segregation ATPase